jgi:hypothetical protein
MRVVLTYRVSDRHVLRTLDWVPNQLVVGQQRNQRDLCLIEKMAVLRKLYTPLARVLLRYAAALG